MRSISLPSPELAGIGLLLIRVVVGVVVFMHGYEKFIIDGIAATEDFFAAQGIPWPWLSAVVVATVEVVSGLALIVGVFTRIAALLAAVVAFSAMGIVHLEHGFFVADGGVELVLLLGVVSFGLVIAGPGAFAVDDYMIRPRVLMGRFDSRIPGR